MERFVKTDTIVLRRTNYKDADRLVVLYTKEKGKITVRAKGVRKLQSKNRGQIELFNQLQASLVAGHAGWILTSTQTTHPFILPSGRNLQFAYAFADMFHALVPEEEPNDELFTLISEFFMLIPTASSESLIVSASLRLLLHLGYLSDESLVHLPKEMKQRAKYFLEDHSLREMMSTSNGQDAALYPFVKDTVEDIIERPLKSSFSQRKFSYQN